MRNLSKRSVSLDFIRRDDHCQGGRLSLDDRAFGAGQNSISDQAAVSSGQVFWITAAASVIFGVGAFAASELLQLSGIYLMIILEYGLLGGIYRWQSKKV